MTRASAWNRRNHGRIERQTRMQSDPRSTRAVWGAIATAVVAAALFGAATPASKWLLSGLTPFQLAGLLYLGAALGVAPAAWKEGSPRLPGRGDHPNQLRLLGAIIAGGIAGPVLLLLG